MYTHLFDVRSHGVPHHGNDPRGVRKRHLARETEEGEEEGRGREEEREGVCINMWQFVGLRTCMYM